MTAFNGYPFSVFLAVLLHGLIIGTLLMIQRVSFEPAELIRPPSVQAQLVAENPQARNEQRQAQQQAEQRQQEQARQQEAERQAEQRRQEEAARQEAQRQAEAEAQRQAEAEAERQRQAQLQRDREAQQERERQQQLEQERQEQQRLEEQRRQEEARQEVLRQQQAEEAARQAEAQAAAQSAAQDQVAGYTAIIHDLVQRNWSRPPSARNGMTAVLRIRMVPTGDVVDVEIVRSSGDVAFDRAAEDAVRAVGRFRELSSMPPRLFEANFRSLLLTFRPEDLLN